MSQSATTPPDDTAPLLPGAIENHLAGDVPTCGPSTTVGEIRRSLTEAHDLAGDIAVCVTRETGARELVGLIPAARCLAAADDVRAEQLMDPDPPVVAPGLSQERAAWKAAQHGETSLAVVDADGSFRGLVPPGRLLSVLLHEHDVDLARIGGYLRSTESTRHSLDEPLATRLWHRLPWLLVGLAGSAAAALVVDGFEASLSADVRLAFFIPGVVYMAAAVGIQTETLVIRGLAAGVGIGKVFRAETLTGLLVGVIIAGIAGAVVGPVLGSAEIGVAVAVSLVAACALATVVAMALPWAISRLGRDPAYGSGPLATMVQDLLSLVVYFAVVQAIVG